MLSNESNIITDIVLCNSLEDITIEIEGEPIIRLPKEPKFNIYYYFNNYVNISCNKELYNVKLQKEYIHNLTTNNKEEDISSIDISYKSNIFNDDTPIHNLIYNTPIHNTNHDRIVITITSSYEGLQYLNKTLESLQNQDINIDKIYLVIPGVYFNNSKERIPNWILDNFEVVLYNYCEPIINILGILNLEQNPDTIIIAVNNGMIYPKCMCKSFKQVILKNKNTIYATFVYKFKSVNYFQQISINNNIGDVYEDNYGVAFLRCHFRNDFIAYYNFLREYEVCKYSVPIIIMNYLQKYKIQVRCLLKKNYNYNLVIPTHNKNLLYLGSGLNYKIIYKYYNTIEILNKLSCLYLKNPIAVVECLRFLIKNPYNIPFHY